MSAAGRRRRAVILAAAAAAAGWAYWKFAIPTHRVEVHSELVILGDLDGDSRWGTGDLAVLDAFLANPFAERDAVAWRLDLNRNGLLDEEDLGLLRALVAAGGDPYASEKTARDRGAVFPRPRELYRYVPASEYRTRPLWALSYPPAADSVLDWLPGFHPPANTGTYAAALDAAVYAEAVRLDHGWRRRDTGLLPVERAYAARKLARARSLFAAGERYELLLLLMELVEDAETLTARDQPETPLRLLAFRDHLRDVLTSRTYAAFTGG